MKKIKKPVSKVIKKARYWTGYLEKKTNAYLKFKKRNAGYNNYTVFAKWYKDYFQDDFQGQPWCAMFVSVIMRRALGREAFDEIMIPFAYCPTGVSWFQNKKRFYKIPKRGDIIFFTNGTEACHTGIVERVDKTYVYTIEGNTSSSSGVVANGGAVERKQYLLHYNKIMGYGRPDYKK